MNSISQFLPITQRGDGQYLVSGRDLYTFLESKQDFTTWMKARIEKYTFVENKDFTLHKIMERGTWKHDYAITLTMAKELAMVESNEKGRQARRYFIAKEEELRQLQRASFQLPATFSEALRMLADEVEQKEKLLQENLQQKEQLKKADAAVEFCQAVAKVEETEAIGDVAKLLGFQGVGRNKLFKILRDKGIFMRTGDRKNLPYQRYIDEGYFQVVETVWDNFSQGKSYISFQTRVTQRGIAYLNKLLSKLGYNKNAV